jgi:CheY-like chemotaxis protein
MTGDLLSLRAMVASREGGLCDLFRRAASISALPTEIVYCRDGANVAASPAGAADLCYLDAALSPEQASRLVADLRGAARPPFIALLATEDATPALEVDGLAGKPSCLEEAKQLLDRSSRVRLTTRVLVVDDSATIRSVVRKALMATRFAFEIGEAADGADALWRVRDGDFDVIFMDQDMPNMTGLECLTKIKRVKPDITAVVMTSLQNEALAAKTRAIGAAYLKKPFFPADIETALCGFYGLHALNPRRQSPFVTAVKF